MLTNEHCKESLSRAYITAVAGRARASISWGREYDYGVDGSVRQIEKAGSRHRETGFFFDFQAKTTVDWTIENDHIVYDLEVKNYNDLAYRSSINAFPMYLILLCLPRNRRTWLKVGTQQLILKECAFYFRIEGEESSNIRTQRIKIPSANIFRPGVVRSILSQVRSGSLHP